MVKYVAVCLLTIGVIMFIHCDDPSEKSESTSDTFKGEAKEVINGGINTNPVDPEGERLIASFAEQDSGGDSKITVGIGILNQFSTENRPLLFRHLATSAKWYVTKEKGKVYACRRFITHDGDWAHTLNGYYTQHKFKNPAYDDFQIRLIVGVDGPVMDKPWKELATVVDANERTVAVKTRKKYNPGLESYVVVRSDGPALEIFETAGTKNRPFTSKALEVVENEFTQLLSSEMARKRGFDTTLMPEVSVMRGAPKLVLASGMQGGIYRVYAYANPQEPGYVYLKAFTAGNNQPLSANRIRTSSTEYIGWSDNSEEHFFYNTLITVYEGDWGNYYPARFELWFVPDSGEKERKLIEETFKIEGWQR